MDVRLSPEQQALRDAAAQVSDRLGVHAVAALDDDERHAKLDAAVLASGWRELRSASDDGTSPWASAVEVALVAEELARGLADAAFLGATLAAELRRAAAAPASAEMETVVLDADLAALAVVPDGGVAIDAGGASSALALDASSRLVAVAIEYPNGPVDLTRPSTVVPAGVEAEPVGVILDERALLRWKALGLSLTTADLVGTMRGALMLATDYARERRQYGAAIGSFQAVQHLLADAHVATEGAHSASLHASWAVDALEPRDALAAAATAKAYASRAARAVCETAIQVHGGIGNTWDCLAHLYLRRALLSIDVLGGVGANLDLVLAHHGIGAR